MNSPITRRRKSFILRVVRCGLSVHSDPRLLEQMLRNLLSNALKYTRRGKVLLGCRRRGGTLSIEVWDTGIGIAEQDLQAIFEEYHQLDNAARERSRGLGLGLSIVQRLATLLGHPVHVRSQPGKGSVFAIDVMLAAERSDDTMESIRSPGTVRRATPARRTGAILVIEDDSELRELLESGPQRATAIAWQQRLTVLRRWICSRDGSFQPDLILADYNLPNGMDGLSGRPRRLEKQLHRQIPVIVLTGDISTDTLRRIASQDCVQLNKPVKAADADAGDPAPACRYRNPRCTSPVRRRFETVQPSDAPVIFVVDDDSHVREAIRSCARSRRPDSRGLCDMRGISRSLSIRPRSMSPDRCLSAGDDRSRTAAAAYMTRGYRSASHHDHRQQRRVDGGRRP